MAKQLASFRGCLLGLAVGDAMGNSVDDWTLEEIHKTFGPDGLMGYDCMNGYATVTAHTQLAAYAANGLLIGMTRGQMRGKMAPYVRYVYLAEYEWARQQSYRREPSKPFFCWVGEDEVIRARRHRDKTMVDILNDGTIGTMEEPRNKYDGAYALPVAVPVGLFYEPGRTDLSEVMRLGAESVALTHGNPTAFLCGGAVSYLIARIAVDGERNIRSLIKETMQALRDQFGHDYAPQVGEVCQAMQTVLSLSISPAIQETEAMEQMHCDSALQVLAGALYACVIHPGSFEDALVTAINHSGRSAAVGALTGAMFGAMTGDRELEAYFLPDLEPVKPLEELAADLYQGCPMMQGSVMFDYEWDEKYVSYRR